MLTLAPIIRLFSKIGKTSKLPAIVSTVITCESPFIKPSSLAKPTRHRIPFPHISPSEPSALNIRIFRSELLDDGQATMRPSAPMPLCLSLTV